MYMYMYITTVCTLLHDYDDIIIVSLSLFQQPRHYSMLVVVRGTVRFLDGMKLAISKIVEYFTGIVINCNVIVMSSSSFW